MDTRVFLDIVFILGLSAVALFVCNRIRIPTIVGFLFAGILAGPHGLGLVHSIHEVETMAEIGIIFLLFSIGIEFSLPGLLKIKRILFLGGLTQVSATFVVTTLVMLGIGMPAAQAILVGMLAALSSTAIVLKTLQKRGDVDTPHGRTALGILIFQDLLVIPLMLAVPLLAGKLSLDPASAWPLILKALAVLAIIFVCARWLLPGLLHRVAATRDPELFLLTVILLGFGIAYSTYTIGLSLALGAFLAGLILSSSQYGMRALGSIIPMRDIFLSFFFVSIGMLLDVRVLADNLLPVILISILVIGGKCVFASLAAVLLNMPLRSSLMAGLSLAQVGEFSFILANAGRDAGLLDPVFFQIFLDVAIISMIAAPFLIEQSRRIAGFFVKLPLLSRLRDGGVQAAQRTRLSGHLIIIGFGLGGRHVAEAADACGIPYAVIEANPDTVRTEKEYGRAVFHGDATSRALLDHAGVCDAHAAVVMMSDPVATRRVVDEIRALSTSIYIIVRTRYFADLEFLYALGANEVIAEEYETSIEIFTRMLRRYFIPQDEIDSFSRRIRERGYGMLRTKTSESKKIQQLAEMLSEVDVRMMRVEQGCGAAHKTLAELNLRKDYGIMVFAIIQNGERIPLPEADHRMEPGDTVIAVGMPELLIFAEGIFRAGRDTDEH